MNGASKNRAQSCSSSVSYTSRNPMTCSRFVPRLNEPDLSRKAAAAPCQTADSQKRARGLFSHFHASSCTPTENEMSEEKITQSRDHPPLTDVRTFSPHLLRSADCDS